MFQLIIRPWVRVSSSLVSSSSTLCSEFFPCIDMIPTVENKPFWKLIIFFTICSGIIACFTVIQKREFFPSHYAHLYPNSSGAAPIKQKEERPVVNNQKEDPPKVPSKQNNEPHTTKKLSENSPTTKHEQQPIDHKANIKPDATRQVEFILIVGAFSSEVRAKELRNNLLQKYPTTKIVTLKSKGKKLFRVEVARDKNRKKIDLMRTELIAKGYSDCWFYKE